MASGSREIGDIFLRFLVEFLLAGNIAEIIGLAVIFRIAGRHIFVDFHLAHRIDNHDLRLLKNS
jgi:hypothetical protein